MKLRISGAKFSAIVGIGDELKQKSIETGVEYLYLNRGINNVVRIDLSEVIPLLDFNSDAMQFYAPTTGMPGIRRAINDEFFMGQDSVANISITAGGMDALLQIFGILDVPVVYTHEFFWGAYANMFKISGHKHGFYKTIEELEAHPEKFSDSGMIICDPNNPLGDKFDDDRLLKIIEKLGEYNCTVVWDGPYRRLFYDKTDDFYVRLSKFDHVIIAESFSKSVGLSGQRLGFIYTRNEAFNKELAIKLLYSGNGTNTFAQLLVEKLLTTPEGRKATDKFKLDTVKAIGENIKYLQERNLLADGLYDSSEPVGIFVVIKVPYSKLLEHNIGSVPISYFTKNPDYPDTKYSRICVSVPTAKFIAYFENINV